MSKDEKAAMSCRFGPLRKFHVFVKKDLSVMKINKVPLGTGSFNRLSEE